MHFELKNTIITYQRLVIESFKVLIGIMVEVYIDDMVIKSYTLEDHLGDIHQGALTMSKNLIGG